MSKKLTLRAWAERNYESDSVPHKNTLHRWARDGWIFPVPEKQGRRYMCEAHAKFVGPRPDPSVLASVYEAA